MIQPVKEKIILGIDPGTNIMGYGVLKVTGVKPEVMTLGVIDLRKCTDSYLKLKHIYERVQGIIASYLPDELAIEALREERAVHAEVRTCTGSSHCGRTDA